MGQQKYALEVIAKYYFNVKYLKSIHIILFLFLVLTKQPTIYAQNNQNLDGYLQSVLNIDYLLAISKLKKTNNNDINSQAISLLEVLYKSGQIPHVPKEKIGSNSNEKAKIINLIQLGYYKLYYQPQEKNTLIYFIDAYNLSKSINNSSLKKLCLLSILEFYHFEYAQTHTRYLKYLEEFESLANTPIEKCWANLYTLYFLYQSIANFNQQKVDEAFLKLEINVKQLPTTHNFYTLFNSIKAIKMEYSDDLVNAYSTHKEVIKTSKGKPFFNFLIFRSYIRISEIHYKWKEYDKGIDAINQSINQSITLINQT